ncbi:THUMP domain-containing class I SAM-dependent RNA methyltransferase [Pseudalkalibacillus decolorationis]|uniref:THUMP domain-containing class I SAM-dependent RNA methyltransferase n=1 Tax=Pseudalkalibacillus decolorationis TaxID=163879 RepID=UPI0021493085|nr:class I SAM-dependent RNA methyltransferase [Pseudalkalibacillus decolorationis]
MKPITLIATAAMGLEAIVANEVRQLGYENVTVENGKIIVEADESAIPRLNLWLRTADRIKIKIGGFKALSFEELFEKTKALPWGDYLPENAEFPVIGRSVKSKLFSVSDCQAIVKKAIVENMKETYNVEGWLPESGAFYRVEVALHKDIATLTIDTSGEALHKRGYRYLHNEAPLKETLAAALIQLTNWKADRPFLDPFCGSGTIPIEAAMIAKNIAPGLNREFASENWSWLDKKLWYTAVEEAHDLANFDLPVDILGTDIDHKMIELSENNAAEAGLEDSLRFKQMQVKDFTTKSQYGYAIGNPPYGERLNERDYVERLYRDLGEVFRANETWSFYILTSYEKFEALYGKPASKKRKLYNGDLKCHYYQYFGKKPPRRHVDV